MLRKPYPTDLSDAEWAVLEPWIPQPKPGGQPPRHARRELVNATRYILRGGIAWRLLPHEFPPGQTVYHDFRLWRRDGTWERTHAAVRAQIRQQAGRGTDPTAAILDSQSVRTTEKGGRAVTMGPRS